MTVKNAFATLLSLALALTAAAALGEDARPARDLSGLIEADGRVTGAITGMTKDAAPRPGVALLVDAPLPADFTADQRVILTTQPVFFDDSALLAAMESTGAANIRIEDYDHGSGFWGYATGDPKPAAMTPDEAREHAVQVAEAFVKTVGAGEIAVLTALRPEDEAKGSAISAAPEAREAIEARTLREWFTEDRDYTEVRFAFKLRGLRTVGGFMRRDEDGEARLGAGCGSLRVGDAGEAREASLLYAPQEVSAEPYAGELIGWREALETVAQNFGVTAYGEKRTDERGRETPAMRFAVTGIEPGYATEDAKTYVPAWLFTIDRMREEDGALLGHPSTHAVDAITGKAVTF